MATLTALRRRFVRSEDFGSEVIELALALPILLLVVAGIMDFGFLFERYEVVTNAAREGARMAVLPGYSCDNTLTSDVGSRVQAYLQSSGLTDTPTVTCCNPSTPAIAACPATATSVTTPSGLTVQLATVTVTYPSAFLFVGPIAALIGGSGPAAATLTGVSVMRVEASGSS
jgi:Flp pilus assembly protein TadG